MKKRLILFIKYYFFWYLFFVFSKLLFLLYHFNLSRHLPFSDWLRIIIYGFKLDISTTSYIMILPCVFILLTSFYKTRLLYYLFNIYTLLALIVVTFLVVSDLQLYTYWGFRLDSTPLLYMDNPHAMFASISVIWIVLLLVLVVFLVSVFYLFYRRSIANSIKNIDPSPLILLIFPIIAAALIIPIRGGINVASVNVSTAYFHKNNFANQAAINCIWNLGFSLTELNNLRNKFIFFEEQKAENIVDDLYMDKGKTKKVLRINRPNIIFVAIESFTSKVIEPLGGIRGITPGINKLIHEGIFFDHFYASGDRTDKAMVAILGGYPSQPTTNIIRYPYKTGKLDFITQMIKPYGYHSAFYYGGSVDFAYYGTLLNLAGFDKIISQRDFGQDANDSKWGAWDHVVFNRLIAETGDDESLFFKFLFTLTSHPPYAIPVAPLLPGGDDDTKFLNSVHYTDKCIYDFIEHAKKKKWWKNTLIILVADHGVIAPGNTPNFSSEKFSIPMLWLGGALNVKDTIIHTYSSQTDIEKTLLEQLDIHKRLSFGKNIFSTGVKSYAYYTFNNGFGFLTDSFKLIYDNNNNKYIVEEGRISPAVKNTGKAYLQNETNDFIRK